MESVKRERNQEGVGVELCAEKKGYGRSNKGNFMGSY